MVSKQIDYLIKVAGDTSFKRTSYPSEFKLIRPIKGIVSTDAQGIISTKHTNFSLGVVSSKAN